MDLYIIRHADAVPLGEDGITDDEQRPLTGRGKKQAKAVARALQRRGVRLGLLYTSPLVRARETAEGILAAWDGPAPEPLPCDELAPGGKSKALARFLEGIDGQSIALVGHEPDLSEHVVWFMGSKKAQLALAKAGVAFLRFGDEIGKGTGTLVWLVTPAWMEE